MLGIRPAVALSLAAVLAATGALVLWSLDRPPAAPAPRSEPAPTALLEPDGIVVRAARPRPAGPAPSRPPEPQPQRAAEPEPQARAPGEVPHEVVAAWGDEASASGLHRAVRVVVEPSLATRELEALARSLRARHGDAVVLDVRIYDDAESARGRARDARARSASHLVAQVLRNDRLGLDVIRVRGIPVEP